MSNTMVPVRRNYIIFYSLMSYFAKVYVNGTILLIKQLQLTDIYFSRLCGLREGCGSID